MSFDRKITFPEVVIEAEGTLTTSDYDFNSLPNSLMFVDVHRAVLVNGRPQILWYAETQLEIGTDNPQNPNSSESLLIIGNDMSGQPVPDRWRETYLALSFQSGAIVLVHTSKSAWLLNAETQASGSSPWTGRTDDDAHASSFEYKIARDNQGGELTPLTGPVIWSEITIAEYAAGTIPAAFTSQNLLETTVWAELSEGGSSIDFNLTLGEGGREETLTLKTRYLPTILKRTSFLYEDTEYRVLNVDRIGRKRFLMVTGVHELESISDG